MDADELYGLPLDEFIPARGALAKELRKAGRRDEAAEVAARRKPSVAAWAVNQLVRTQPPAVKDLLGAGDELRDAQSDLLAGRGDGRALRAAGDRERAAVEDLVERARGLLSSAGNELSAGVIDRVSDTLHAAALDEDAREQVRDGRLERELRHVGLGFGLGAGGAPEPKPRPRSSAKQPGAAEDPQAAKPARGAEKGAADESSSAKKASAAKGETAAVRKRAQRERAAAEREEAERERRERAAARRDARAAHACAKRRAAAATRVLHAAQERHDEAAQALEEADEALATAREDAAGANEALRGARADLEEAERTS